MPQPKPPGDQLTVRGSLNWLFIFMMAHARCVTPFIRDRIGAKAQGFSMLVVGILMFYVAVLTVDEPFFYFCVAWLFAVVNQRLSAANFRKKFQVHSRYSGRPWIAEFIGCKNEGVARLIIEPLLCFAVGFYLSQFSLNLGRLVGGAGMSLMLIELMTRRFMEEREQAVIDAYLESQELERGVRDRLGF